MINGGRVLGLVPARGGSKGVPRKNLQPLGGKPLLQWTAEAALASRCIDRTVLSTDDDEIADLGVRLGLEVPFRRPRTASTDDAVAREVVEHALSVLDEAFEYLVYLQPTSPFRTSVDIDTCLGAVGAHAADFAVSVRPAVDRPEWMVYVNPRGRIQALTGAFDFSPRQQYREAYVVNGAIYVGRVEAYRRTGTFLTEATLAYVMPPERSVDIDTTSDIAAAESLLERS